MARQSQTLADFNPSGDERVTRIKSAADALIKMVRTMTAVDGPETKRRAALAITNFEQGAMWAVKALHSEDALCGDDGGSGTSEPAARVEDDGVAPDDAA